MPPVDAHCVRNPFTVARQPYPWDRPAGSVEQTDQTCANGMRILSYKLQDSGVARHFFTGNDARLQELPTRLFRELQMSVQLVMRALKSDFAAGNFYSCCVGSQAGESSTVAWTEAPQCISTARDFMLNTWRLEGHGKGEALQIQGLAVIGWDSRGTRRGVIQANKSPVVILCLGADVEISILAKPDTSLLPSSSMASAPETEAVAPQGDEGLAPVENPSASANGPTQASAPVSFKKLMPKEALLVTLLHGDMLVLQDDEFQYSMKRTGTSIVVVGTS